MQFTKEEKILLRRLVNISLEEVMWDYSCCSDMGVLSINGRPVILNKQQINNLLSVRSKINKEMKLW